MIIPYCVLKGRNNAATQHALFFTRDLVIELGDISSSQNVGNVKGKTGFKIPMKRINYLFL